MSEKRFIIKYDTLEGEPIKTIRMHGRTKAEAKYNFKFLYPRYLIVKIYDEFIEDVPTNIEMGFTREELGLKNTAKTGRF